MMHFVFLFLLDSRFYYYYYFQFLLCLFFGLFCFVGFCYLMNWEEGFYVFFTCQLGLLFDKLGGIKFVLLFPNSQSELVKFYKHQICVIPCCLANQQKRQLVACNSRFHFLLLLHKLAKPIVCSLQFLVLCFVCCSTNLIVFSFICCLALNESIGSIIQ